MLNLDAIKPRTVDFELGGEKYSLPSIDALDADNVLGLVMDGGTSVDMMALFKAVLEKHAPGALEKMRVDQMRALLGEWQKSGNAGESSPSSD